MNSARFSVITLYCTLVHLSLVCMPRLLAAVRSARPLHAQRVVGVRITASVLLQERERDQIDGHHVDGATRQPVVNAHPSFVRRDFPPDLSVTCSASADRPDH